MSRAEERNRQADLIADMSRAKCVREAALMLTLSLTGIDFDDDVVQNTAANVAAVAQEYGASPDDVQRALTYLEPVLYIDIKGPEIL